MKKLRRIGKLLLVAVLICSTLLLTSCASSKVVVEDASGTAGALTWNYKKDSATLTISGNGPIENFAASDKVAWSAVRAGVKKLVVSEGITEIGDYAFYYMPQLTEISLPSTVTRIGKCAFAFCSSMTAISVPAGVTSVGESAFEACSSLLAIRLQEACTSIGPRAFAFCRSLEKVFVFGKLDAIGAQTFRDCVKLNELVFHTEVQSKPCDATAFDGAAINMSQAQFSTTNDGSSSVTVRYVDEAGNEVFASETKTGSYGEGYSFTPQAKEGYTPDKTNISGTFGVSDQTVTVTYKANAPVETQPSEETTAPVGEPEQPKELTGGTIAAIVIMVVILVGIGIAAFFILRMDKNASQTVRKNQDGGKNGKDKKKK